ncbi:MAG: SAM-dependent methyltransferase [Planctomycetota bacterium]
MSSVDYRQAVGGSAWHDDEWKAFIEGLSRRRPKVLRWRADLPATIPNPTWSGEPVPWYPRARYASDPAGSDHRATRTLEYAAGSFYSQDAGSLLALAACGADTGELEGKLVCDLCAAPGGKASGLLEGIGQTGFLLAAEPIRSRHAALAFNLARVGVDRYAIAGADPEILAQNIPGVFDLVLVDAPCSGQAMMARGKQSASSVTLRSIESNAMRQQRILRAASELLRPGGQLIYSTCTFAIAENESQVRFMIDNLNLQPRSVERLHSHASADAPASYRLWPHRDDCDGAFAASLEKPLTSIPSRPSGGPTKPGKWRSHDGELRDHVRPSPECRTLLMKLFGQDYVDNLAIARDDWIVDCYGPGVPDWLDRIDVVGPECLHRTGTTWKPSHAAALRRHSHAQCPQRLELDDARAIRFASGQSFAMDSDPGWHVATWSGQPMGWIKIVEGTGKNHLPTYARLAIESKPN